MLSEREKEIANEAFMVGRLYATNGEQQGPAEIYNKLIERCELVASRADSKENVEETTENDQYYVQDVSRGYVGNSMVWWKHNDSGYVCDIKLARVWTKEEAERQCQAAGDLRMWKKSYIDARIQSHIDMQTVDYRSVESH